jgi:hypothetical protein
MGQQGWIYRGCTGVRTPVGLGQHGCKGAAKNQIQKYDTISNTITVIGNHDFLPIK